MLTWLNAPHTQSRLAVISYAEEDRRVFEDAFEVFGDFFFGKQRGHQSCWDQRASQHGDVIRLNCNVPCVKADSELTSPVACENIYQRLRLHVFHII